MAYEKLQLHKEAQAANKLVDKIFRKINFSIHSEDLKTVRKHVYQLYRISPTNQNIKKHLIRMILIPIEDVPEPEKSIILRAGKHDFS
ncbi:MAG: hypothetical protein RLT87_07455 [Gammaproteobacteria bacterium]